MGRFWAAARVAAFFLIAMCGSSAADSLDAEMTVAEYAVAYDASDGQRNIDMPNFRHDYAWQLSYRSEAASALAQLAQERIPGMNIELDDSWVIGLRFEWDYGWTR